MQGVIFVLGLILSIIIFYGVSVSAGVIFFAGLIFSLLLSVMLHYFFIRNNTKDIFFSSSFFRDMLSDMGFEAFHTRLLEKFPSLKSLTIFFVQEFHIKSLHTAPLLLTQSDQKLIKKVASLSLNNSYELNAQDFSFYTESNPLFAYTYSIPIFNKKIVFLTEFYKPYFFSLAIHEELKAIYDMISTIVYMAEFDAGNTNVFSLLKESAFNSPYAFGVCNSLGGLSFGNDALYALFQGDIPNFMDLIGSEIFMLLLDGKKIGQSFIVQGRRIQLEAYPLSNKNFLITQCLFVFVDEQVEHKREMLGEASSLRRYTSGNSVIGAAMFTMDGVILYSNDAFINRLEVYKVREAKQKNIYELFQVTKEHFQSIVETVVSGEEIKTTLVSRDTDEELQVLFKGVVFGDRTILEVVLEEDSIYQENMSYLDKETQELYQELQTARSVQEHILALPTIYRPGISVNTLYLPAHQLSGDFFTIIPFEDNKLGILIADVSGHGVSASLITAALKILLEFAPKETVGLSKFISYLNTYLADILPEGSFVTLFYGIIDFDEYTMQYINCGHPFPLLEDLTTNEIKILEGMGYPLGGLLNVSFDELIHTIELPIKCKLWLYTDGILQHVPGMKIKEKLQKISSVIDKNKGVSDKELLKTIHQQLMVYHSSIPEDDVSMMLISLDRSLTHKHYLKVSSTILEVDTVTEQIGSYIQKEANLSDAVYWKLRTCFYESLLNAVVHGNKYNTQKRVYVAFRMMSNIIILKIRDEGVGFNYKNIPDPFHPDNILKDYGRGVAMLNTLADRVKFNPKGNEVTLFFKIKNDEDDK